MWPFDERRRNKRRKVAWEASLVCRFASLHRTVPVTVTEVSLSGVRLHLKRIQIGPHHLFASAAPVELELVIEAPRGIVRSSIEFRWYNQPETEGLFLVGAEFVNMEPESKQTLKISLKGL